MAAASPFLFTSLAFEGEEPAMTMEGMKLWKTAYEGKNFVKICVTPEFDWLKSAAPKLPKLPDGSCPQWCPATHFGYLESGEMKLKFKDGSEQVVKAGESYLVPPGHLPEITKDSVMVEFSQDPLVTKFMDGPDATPTPAPAEEPPSEFMCQPCTEDMGEPTKAMDNFKVYIDKKEGRQMMRIVVEPGFDWLKTVSPILPKLANGCSPEWCPATHFGYLEKGEMGIVFEDGTEKVVKAGESYFVGAGHRPIINEHTVAVEFSQDPVLLKQAHMTKE